MEQVLTKHPRVDVADVLRGFAVMGIILLHSIEHFNFYWFPDPATQSGFLNFCDKAIWDGMFFLFGGKGYAIFALLFGFSFFIMDDNERRRGGDFRLRFCWRMVLLFLFGNFNAAFFTGEVLVLYSLVGFILPLVCRLKDRTLLIIACILLLQPLALWFTLRASLDPSFVTPSIPSRELWAAAGRVQNGGTFLETVRVNLWEGQLASLAWAWDNARVFQTAALFILGLLIGRRRLFLEENHRVWLRVLAWALIAFFPLYGLSNLLPHHIANRNVLTPLLLVINSLHKFAFMLILVSGIILAFYNTRLKGTLMRLAPYGQMSLTNYIMQSIIGSFLFYHWGLYLRLGTTASFALGIVLFLLQLAFCTWWMKHHTHGPLEYIWKRLTWLGSGRDAIRK
ncbi:MAG: DUF418 domain-containing protein [Bacteroidales bacterium]|nr:DUF418 domain-containing protein [Bacteroidales bacterium]